MMFTITNPTAPITIFISESLPANDTGFSGVPRQYDTIQNGLMDVSFNWDPRNRFSPENIWNSIDYLTAAGFQGQPVVQHLVIVAASTPFDDTFGVNPTNYSGSTRWHQLALKLSQANIQCHLVMSPHQDMRPLATLFEETLRLQNSIEEPPSFPVDFSEVLCRLAARPQLHSAPAHLNPASQRVLPRRNYSFPPSSHTEIGDNMLGLPSSSEPESPPSLVSQLQQVHGLTKKKVYGAKPVHKPFVGEERLRKDSNAPAPLVLPLVKASPRSNASGRALSTSKAARISRVAQSSPTEMQARRPGLPRRNSRIPSPEDEIYTSSPAFTSPPVSPTSLTNMYIQTAPIGTPHTETIMEPNWSTMPYKPLLPSLSQPNLSQSRVGLYSATPTLGQSLSTPWQDNRMDASQSSVPSQPRANHDALAGSYKKRRSSEGGADSPSHRLPRRSSCPSDEEPFNFTAEYVAATAAMFKTEVLPAYPDLQPAFSEVVSPRRAFYIARDQSMPPSPCSYDPGELYVAAEREEFHQQSLKYPVPAPGSPRLSYATSYSPGSTSSLTGWAG
ncbi:hypothetical protein DXG01_012250 [Tephrocybe rancida]|nr:hypothetical protein DXG01_012250 [Tephrocybe rancida]